MIRSGLDTRPVGERAVAAALRPWERQLLILSLRRWSVGGAMAGIVAGIAMLLVGWMAPVPESELRPFALELALASMLAAVLVGLWPRGHLRRAADLDRRIALGDRLTTAWLFRSSDEPIARLQRQDTLDRLGGRFPGAELEWRPSRRLLAALGAAAFVFGVLLVAPSPQQAALDRAAAEQLAVTQAEQQLDVLRQQAAASRDLSPEQARQLSELLQQAQDDLKGSQRQQDATAVLARAEQRLTQQLGDPNADLRNQALAAMSETLAAEPRTQALADALEHEDARATADAMNALAASADQLSDVERQALSRALQRAANVGRSDARSSDALRAAAQAIASHSSSASARESLSAADQALEDAIQAAQAQAAVNATARQLSDLQTRLGSGLPLDHPASQADRSSSEGRAAGTAVPAGTPVPLGGFGSQQLPEPANGPADGAGFGAPGGLAGATDASQSQPPETIFIPGRESDGPASQDLVEQPFTLRGAPRPYRDVLTQYAQASRDYVDRPDVSPAVREMVKQYFQSLEDEQ